MIVYLCCSVNDILRDTDSELEEDEPAASRGKKKPKRKTGAAWLKEGKTEEDIVDFLDPSVSKKVLGRNRDGGVRPTFSLDSGVRPTFSHLTVGSDQHFHIRMGSDQHFHTGQWDQADIFTSS